MKKKSWIRNRNKENTSPSCSPDEQKMKSRQTENTELDKSLTPIEEQLVEELKKHFNT